MKRTRSTFISAFLSTWTPDFGSPTDPRVATGLIGALFFFLLVASIGATPLGRQMYVRGTYAASSLHSFVADTTGGSSGILSSSSAPALRRFPSHPSNKLTPYMDPGASGGSVPNPGALQRFHGLLNQFTQRQAHDDNFTVRVIDRRSDEVLELYEFETLRASHQNDDAPDWPVIDEHRSDVTRTLVNKYARQGVPREDITVRWGRSNQIAEAHERSRPYRAYEIQLAHALDLSLLVTQIGTVETFNRDQLVSPVGARSRYQMMPWILRQSGVHKYPLKTEGGGTIEVEEAHHPLLTLEPAYLLLRGYVNAVGHEIPGISAYHTGPGNIYKLYRSYFTSTEHYTAGSTVVDAYVWALTDGFDTVSSGSTFGPYSRGYVPSAYGALTAVDHRPLDLSGTVETSRVQLRRDARLSLQELLTTLASSGRLLDWSPFNSEGSLYDRFRALNPHLNLPASSDGDVPPAGNVQLVASSNGHAVRFFLPPKAPNALRAAGVDVLDADRTRRFDDATFALPTPDQKTKWDREYEALIDDIKGFGFTPENREQLRRLKDTFVKLAARHPSPYRQRQLSIIQTHLRIWDSEPWDKLSDLTLRKTGKRKALVEPPIPLPVGNEMTAGSVVGNFVP